ncbi:MAG: FemAB family PEP-CTERM system-associated protein [Acidobacteriota bacterium]|nr:FemAB family PEP-CTERM system-associated protein [Acidobacteriota bacterium]
MEIKPYTPTVAERWDEFVQRHKAATFCHLSGWQRVVENVWQHRQQSLFAERDGKIVGVLPLFLVNGWFGSMLVSIPNAVYGGIVADDLTAHQALIAAAQALAEDQQVDYLELRDSQTAPPQQGFLPQDLYVSFEHPIPNNEEDLMSSFPRDVRRMIRLGKQFGFRASVGGIELLDEFYNLYAASVRRLGTPVFPKKLFAEFLCRFPTASDILLLRDGQRAAAAVLSFYFRETVMPYYAGANPAYHRAGINNYLYWELMQRAAARGFTRFDFGRSKRGTGAYEFKRGWRMTERELPYRFFLVRADKLPNLNPTNPKFNLMIETWKRMPLWLTELIGPKIVRNFP